MPYYRVVAITQGPSGPLGDDLGTIQATDPSAAEALGRARAVRYGMGARVVRLDISLTTPPRPGRFLED